MKRLQDIDLKLLRSFQAIVNAGGITGAQATLNCSQSTLSTQLADLEKRLGFRVCQRGRGGFSLTSEGTKLMDALEDLFSAADRFQNAVATISGEMRGILRIGIMDAMLANTCWPLKEVLGRFSKQAQETYVDLSMLAPPAMGPKLLEGKLDAVIGPSPTKHAGIEYVPLFQERHSIHAAPTHTLSNLTNIGFEELSNHALIVTPGDLQRFPFIRRRRRAHGEQASQAENIYPSATVDQIETHAILICSGRFVGFLPDYYGRTRADLKALDTRAELTYHSPVYLAYRKNADMNIVLRSFIRRAKEQKLIENDMYKSGEITHLQK